MERRNALLAGCAMAAALCVCAVPAAAQGTAQNLDADGVAIKGHDPVAYFTMSKPAKGSADFSARHDGATYWFANAEHQKAFNAQPAKYAPQYGGYCAYGVSKGAKPDIDPTAFSVVDGKLYLNLNPSIQERWAKDSSGYIRQADEKWKTLGVR